MFIRILFVVVVVLDVFNKSVFLCSAIETQTEESPSPLENRNLMGKTQDAEQKETYWPPNTLETVHQDVRTSSKKKDIDLSKENHRRPKFFGPLSFLGGMGAGRLASAATEANANIAGKLLNGEISIQLGSPPVEYLANLYNPHPLTYIPYPYPVFYSFRDSANANGGAKKSEQPKGTEKKLDVEEVKAEPSTEWNETAVSTTTERNLLKIVNKVAEDVAAVESDGDKNDAGPSFRAGAQAEAPKTNGTALDAASTNNITNGTITHSFHGYYSGHPQDIAHYVLATEHPGVPYLEDYLGSHYGVPAPEKFAPFNSYSHSYPPYRDSLSAYDSPIEFYNADRYVYETDGSRKFNGFKPMLR